MKTETVCGWLAVPRGGGSLGRAHTRYHERPRAALATCTYLEASGNAVRHKAGTQIELDLTEGRPRRAQRTHSFTLFPGKNPVSRGPTPQATYATESRLGARGVAPTS